MTRCGHALRRRQRDSVVNVLSGGSHERAPALDPSSNDLPVLLEDVEAVAFAVPPDVQAALAAEAAKAGRHLLLDKPVATHADRAHQLRDAAAAHGVASVVFFTHRFTATTADWFATLSAEGGWEGGSVVWLACLDSPENPYRDSSWRRERGALWDIGPHVLSTLVAALGPVESVLARAGARDLVHLVLQHASGPTSTASVSLTAPPAASLHQVLVWGERGVRTMPDRTAGDAVPGYAAAASALRRSAATGQPDAADLALGVRIVELLEEAERQL